MIQEGFEKSLSTAPEKGDDSFGDLPAGPPDASLPAETLSGWGKVDNAPEEVDGDFKLTPEQETELKKFRERTDVASSLIKEYLPEIDFEQMVCEQDKTERVQLTQEQVSYARRLRKNHNFDIGAVASEIAKSPVDETEFKEYVGEIFSFVKELYGENLKTTVENIKSLMPLVCIREQIPLYRDFVHEWREIFPLANENPDEQRKSTESLKHALIEVTESNRWPRPTFNEMQLREGFVGMLGTHKFVQSLPQGINNDLKQEFLTGGERVAIGVRDHIQVERLLSIYRDIAPLGGGDVTKKFAKAVGEYTSHHPLGEEAHEGLEKGFLPALQSHDPQVDVISKGGNVWGMRRGDFGVADFICHAYAKKITPPNINELMLTAREVPTTELAKFEQKRLDGLSLRNPFGALRDFIHDQRPGVHDVIVAMVSYYETHDPKELEKLLPKTEGYLSSVERQQAILDLQQYDKEVEEKMGGQKQMTKIIDILKRLEVNTKPSPDVPPQTSDSKLNGLLGQVLTGKGKNRVAPQMLHQATDYINEDLLTMMKNGQVGMEPNMILVLAWLDQRGFEILQTMSYEDQSRIYREPWFHSLLKFHELTASAKNFDKEDFQKFIQVVVEQTTPEEAGRRIAEHEREHIVSLIQNLKETGQEKKIGALWSGNLSHELMALVDSKPASTEYGRKHREEMMRPHHERLKGD